MLLTFPRATVVLSHLQSFPGAAAPHGPIRPLPCVLLVAPFGPVSRDPAPACRAGLLLGSLLAQEVDEPVVLVRHGQREGRLLIRVLRIDIGPV